MCWVSPPWFSLSQSEASDGHPSSRRVPTQSRYTRHSLCFITSDIHNRLVDIQVCKTGWASVPVMGLVPPRGSSTVGCILQYLPSRPRKKKVQIVFINLIMAILGRRQRRFDAAEWDFPQASVQLSLWIANKVYREMKDGLWQISPFETPHLPLTICLCNISRLWHCIIPAKRVKLGTIIGAGQPQIWVSPLLSVKVIISKTGKHSFHSAEEGICCSEGHPENGQGGFHHGELSG